MRTKRALLAMTCAATLVATACGSDEAPSAADSTGGSAQPGDSSAATGEQVTLTIESWRSDDQAIWDDVILPAFEASHPNIKVEFAPTAPTEYNAALSSRLESDTAGDLIACRPFDGSLPLFDDGFLAPVNDVPGVSAFGEVARSGWVTDDGATTYCVPMASVIHGFYYNKDVFAELGLEVPTTISEFHAVLDAVAESGTTPIAQGTKDQWDNAEVSFSMVGPNFWNGEEGRVGLIDGTAKFTDAPFVDTFAELASWEPYLPDGAAGIGYDDSKVLFTAGQGAIFPGGSWEITGFSEAPFEVGVFKPPMPDDKSECYIADHVDIGIGMNAGGSHTAEATEFLAWVASAEFASLYANALPGFFSLQSEPVTLENELAKEFVSWRSDCKTTIRLPAQKLNRGTPALWDEVYETSSQVMSGTMTPTDAAARLQEGLDAWYTPAG